VFPLYLGDDKTDEDAFRVCTISRSFLLKALCSSFFISKFMWQRMNLEGVDVCSEHGFCLQAASKRKVALSVFKF
jgi:trehalose-6-phosphatase